MLIRTMVVMVRRRRVMRCRRWMQVTAERRFLPHQERFCVLKHILFYFE